MMAVAQPGESLLENRMQPDCHHKASLSLLQPSNGLVIVETLVGADDNLPDALRNSGKTSCQQVANSSARISVTRTQFPMPEVLGLTFEAEQRMIRSSSRLEGVITNVGGFLFSINDQGCGIQIENQTPGPRWSDTHLGQKAIVELAQPRQGLRRHPHQKASQRRSVGIVRQATQVLKDTVGLQQMRGFDPFETENHRIDDRQQQLADAVAIVPLGQTHIFCDCFLETYLSQKAMQQIDATIMSEALIAKRNSKFSRAFWHANESYLRGSFHSPGQKSSLA